MFGLLVQSGGSEAAGRVATFAAGARAPRRHVALPELHPRRRGGVTLSPIVWLDYFAVAAVPLGDRTTSALARSGSCRSPHGDSGARLGIGDSADIPRVLVVFPIVFVVEFVTSRAGALEATFPTSSSGAVPSVRAWSVGAESGSDEVPRSRGRVERFRATRRDPRRAARWLGAGLAEKEPRLHQVRHLLRIHPHQARRPDVGRDGSRERTTTPDGTGVSHDRPVTFHADDAVHDRERRTHRRGDVEDGLRDAAHWKTSFGHPYTRPGMQPKQFLSESVTPTQWWVLSFGIETTTSVSPQHAQAPRARAVPV